MYLRIQALVTPGQLVTYEITVTNHGPEADQNAIVSDIFPEEIVGVTWTCTASADSSCTPSGTGAINEQVSLAVGGSVSYVVTGQVAITATGSSI